MTQQPDRERFRRLPEPVRPEDVVESVATDSPRLPDGGEDREVLLRLAGA